MSACPNKQFLGWSVVFYDDSDSSRIQQSFREPWTEKSKQLALNLAKIRKTCVYFLRRFIWFSTFLLRRYISFFLGLYALLSGVGPLVHLFFIKITAIKYDDRVVRVILKLFLSNLTPNVLVEGENMLQHQYLPLWNTGQLPPAHVSLR